MHRGATMATAFKKVSRTKQSKFARGLSGIAVSVLLASCGGGDTPTSLSSPSSTPPPPAPITYTSATLSKSYQIHTVSSEQVIDLAPLYGLR